MSAPVEGLGFEAFLASTRSEIDAEIDRRLTAAAGDSAELAEAMRYSVFAGGKRFRPALVLLAGEAAGAERRLLLPAAAAIEMIHTFSLVHDDLPALDDDDLRRGVPTLHRAFDEATAILAGDALLALGLGLVAGAPDEIPVARRASALAIVCEAIGPRGMIGGQMADLAAERAWPDDAERALERIHLGKTAALIAASLRIGGVLAGGDAAIDLRLRRFGVAIGLIFQIGDDILDVEGSADALGKTPGKDARAHKLTYPGLRGLAASRARLAELAAEAELQLRDFPGDRTLLLALLDFLARRDR